MKPTEAVDAIRMFGDYGGYAGVLTGAFILLMIFVLIGFQWYIKSERKDRTARDTANYAHQKEQNEAFLKTLNQRLEAEATAAERYNAAFDKRLAVEEKWREAISKNTDTVHMLASSLAGRPCLSAAKPSETRIMHPAQQE